MEVKLAHHVTQPKSKDERACSSQDKGVHAARLKGSVEDVSYHEWFHRPLKKCLC